jgi:hypothetical protein
MKHNGHKECYGDMYPDALHFRPDARMAGKVFSYELDTAGGVGRSKREIAVDIAAWDDCQRCSEFQACYQLSVGKMVLESTIATE